MKRFLNSLVHVTVYVDRQLCHSVTLVMGVRATCFQGQCYNTIILQELLSSANPECTDFNVKFWKFSWSNASNPHFVLPDPNSTLTLKPLTSPLLLGKLFHAARPETKRNHVLEFSVWGRFQYRHAAYLKLIQWLTWWQSDCISLLRYRSDVWEAVLNSTWTLYREH